MNRTFNVTKEQMQGNVPVTVLHVRGWLDAQSEEALLAEARNAYDEGARYLVINLDEVDTLTSAGMRTLQKIYKIFTPQEEAYKVAHVKLCNAPPQVYHVLGITGFLQSIQNYETLQAAVDSF
ncbi:MAG: STAS domain-containing protein [Chloroflexi bacterium]|nr:STAS domain-containing protein [Chloroflexota bacterium]